MSEHTRDRLAWLAAVLVQLIGLVAWALGRPTAGLEVDLDAGGRSAMFALWAGLLVVAGGWWIGARPATPSLAKRFVAPLALAVSAPLCSWR